MKLSGKRKVNKMTIGIIVIIVILVIVAALFLLKGHTDRNILDGPGMINTLSWNLTSVSYSCSGGMEGGYHYMSIASDESGRFIYDYAQSPYNGADEEVLNAEVSETDFGVFREICHSTECLISGEGTPSEYQLLDAPVTTIVFTLDNGRTVTFRDTYEYPSNCDGLFTMVYDALMTIYEHNSNVI